MKKALIILIFTTASLLAKSQTFSWTGNTTIPDNQTVTLPISVSGLPTAINSSFGLAHICVNITHSYDADILVKLQSPDGTIVTLIQNIGGSGDNFTGTCLGMDGTAFTNAIAPYGGIFFPQGNVSLFNNGQNPNGTWNLIVSDVSTPDEGSIQSGSLAFVNNPPTPGVSPGPPTANTNCPSCVCPGGAAGCDLLPDMTSSFKEINLNHTESPGFLYISNATPNIGYGPMDIYGIDSCFCGTTHVPCGTVCPGGETIKQVVKQRVYQKVPGNPVLSYYDRFAGLMSFHPTHGHLHVDDWARYTLRTPTSNPDATTWPILASGTKQSFCLINLGTCSSNPGECVDNNGNPLTTFANNNLGYHSGCGLYQGIYPGNYDVYSISLNDPIPLNGICNGNYYIVSITDPSNNFLESDETNNWVAVPITLTQQNVTPTITASGPTTFCTGGSVTLTSSPASNYLWSPNGETSQSIVVGNAGTYSVSTNCGSVVSQSTAVNVQVVPPGSVVSVSIAITTGSNPACAGVGITFTATPVNGGNAPTYQWKINGSNVGTNSATYTTSTLTNGQIVSCVVTSNIPCLTATPATSNSITMGVNAPTDPSVTIAQTSGNNPQCSGITASFTATVANGSGTSYQWKVNGANAGTNSPVFTSSGLTNNQTVSCDILSTASCPLIRTLGTGTGVNDYRSDLGAPYPSYYGNGRQQYLIKASELTAMGLAAGNITALAFNVSAGVLGDPATLNGYTIKLGQTASTVMTTTFQTPVFTTVFGPVNYTPANNATNTHTFSTPFVWNGTSNIVVDICFSNQVVGNAAYQAYQTPTSFVSTTYYQADGTGGAGACTRTTGNTGSVRPNMTFIAAGIKSASSNVITMAVDPTYTFTGNGNWSVASNWLNNKMPPATLLSCAQIFIDPVAGGECRLDIPQVIPAGAKLTVMPNKKFVVPGDINLQ